MGYTIYKTMKANLEFGESLLASRQLLPFRAGLRETALSCRSSELLSKKDKPTSGPFRWQASKQGYSSCTEQVRAKMGNSIGTVTVQLCANWFHFSRVSSQDLVPSGEQGVQPHQWPGYTPRYFTLSLSPLVFLGESNHGLAALTVNVLIVGPGSHELYCLDTVSYVSKQLITESHK